MIMETKYRNPGKTAPEGVLVRPIHEIGGNGSIVGRLFEDLRPALCYTPDALKTFDVGTTKGVGKNYDGFRVVWTTAKGYEVYNQSCQNCMKLGDERVDQFRQDIRDAAKTDPGVAALVTEHGRAMGIPQ
jgi:hypothetical protein